MERAVEGKASRGECGFPAEAGTLHRAPVGQGPPGPDWLAFSLGFWSGRALATGTAWAGLCLIHHHHVVFTRVPGCDVVRFYDWEVRMLKIEALGRSTIIMKPIEDRLEGVSFH